jgi:hypothetical protein
MIAVAAKAKYAGLRGDMGVTPNRIEVGVRRVVQASLPGQRW